MFEFFVQKMLKKTISPLILVGGRCPPDPSDFGWGGQSTPRHPPKRSSAAIDRGGQTGTPRSNAFFSVPLTTQAPRTTVRPDATRTSGRTSGGTPGRTPGRTFGRTPWCNAPAGRPAGWDRGVMNHSLRLSVSLIGLTIKQMLCLISGPSSKPSLDFLISST